MTKQRVLNMLMACLVLSHSIIANSKSNRILTITKDTQKDLKIAGGAVGGTIVIGGIAYKLQSGNQNAPGDQLVDVENALEDIDSAEYTLSDAAKDILSQDLETFDQLNDAMGLDQEPFARQSSSDLLQGLPEGVEAEIVPTESDFIDQIGILDANPMQTALEADGSVLNGLFQTESQSLDEVFAPLDDLLEIQNAGEFL